MAGRPTQMVELSSPALDALVRGEKPVVALLPVGAVEPHGPHAPLGTDVMIAEGVCERAARRAGDDEPFVSLQLPALPFGVTRYARDFRGTVGLSEETLLGVLVDVGHALRRDGIERVVIVNHHFEPEHVATVRRATGQLREHGMRVAMLDVLRRRNAERLTDEFRRGSCHAGQYETSMVLADRPELVADERRGLPGVSVDMPALIRAGRTSFVELGMRDAYCGDPAAATADEGEQTYGVLAELLLDQMRTLATEA